MQPEAIEAMFATCKRMYEQEKVNECKRQASEPHPMSVGGSAYVLAVEEVKRLVAEDKAIETADTYDEVVERRINLHREAGRKVGHEIFEIGGVELMKKTLDVYVPRPNRSVFDLIWNGIGGWLA